MPNKPGPRIRILHILTLNGALGEYGGPNRVAYELCTNLQAKGHFVQIFTGVEAHSIPQFRDGLMESFEIVRPLSKSFPISSLWSGMLPIRLFQKIKESDLVHIHFARDLIPVLTAFLCVLTRKKFVTQTHGMIIPDNRISIRIIDALFIRYLMKRSAVNFVLTQQELDELTPMGFKCQMIELPNGINVPLDIAVRKENEVPRIVFCSRLHPRKRPTAFLNLAREAFKKNFVGTFEIYGPDGSELDLIQDEIRKDEQLIYAQYKGSIAPSEVMNVLNQSDLLVLPSKNEPFPMVVLEALAVGTPILIMPSCGIASLIKDNYPMMVLESDDEDIFLASKKLLEQGYSIEFRKELQNFCNKNFGIEGVEDKLETVYLKVMMNIRSIN